MVLFFSHLYASNYSSRQRLPVESENLNVGFVVDRVGGLSKAIIVNYSVQTLAPEHPITIWLESEFLMSEAVVCAVFKGMRIDVCGTRSRMFELAAL
jgi:hypothetical protein